MVGILMELFACEWDSWNSNGWNSVGNIEILMEGVQGSAMAAFGDSYSEVDIASVITYTRQAWSNGENGDGVIVTPQDIVAYKNRIDL